MGRGDFLSRARAARKATAQTRGLQIAAAAAARHKYKKQTPNFKPASPAPRRVAEKHEALTTETAVEDSEDCITVPPVVVVLDAEVASVPVGPVVAPADDLIVPPSLYNDDDLWQRDLPSFMNEAPWQTWSKDPSLEIFVGPLTDQARLTVRDVNSMKGTNWFNDEAVYTVLNQFSVTQSAVDRPFIYFPSFFLYLCQGDSKCINPRYYRYQNVERFTGKRRPIDIFARKSIVIPVNKNGNHWCAIVIRLELPRITGTFIDSLAHTDSKEKSVRYAHDWLSLAFRYMIDEYMAKKSGPPPRFDFVYDVESSPRQFNRYDCGPFMIAAVQLLVCGPRPGREDKDLPSHIDWKKMARFRELLQYQCMTNTFWPLYAV